MKTHTARPVLEELQDLYAIAAREHGPQARSTRAIKRSLETLNESPPTPERERKSRAARRSEFRSG